MKSKAPNLQSLLAGKNMKLSQLATELKVNKSQVTRWNQNKVPIERIVQIEAVTGIPRQKLRPDVFAGVKLEQAGRK
jgi:DNA-binding transcriptional regulator YdaS (Cro superfamily)